MHPEEIEGMGNTRHQGILPNTNNKTLEDAQDVQEREDDNNEIEIVFKPEQEEEEEEEDPEEDDKFDPEDDRLIQTRSGRISRPVYKYVSAH